MPRKGQKPAHLPKIGPQILKSGLHIFLTEAGCKESMLLTTAKRTNMGKFVVSTSQV